MSFYDNVLYRYFLNTTWFTWAVVILIFLVNFLMPVLLWHIMSGRKLRKLMFVSTRDESGTQQHK